MRRVFYAALTVIIYLFCGCSSGNNDTTILNASGKHPSGWAVADTGGEHPSAYLAGPSSCYECHGTDLMGGSATSAVSLPPAAASPAMPTALRDIRQAGPTLIPMVRPQKPSQQDRTVSLTVRSVTARISPEVPRKSPA